jgi:crotonobetainyl-CoA:carnitine CoA-transferase CaiB-like acyl-CoA transferase
MTKPLDGVTVLDLTRLLPGPAATMMLANFGAEVIKIEEPEKGDYARAGHPRIHGVGASFALLNRGKKSVAINLKDPRGKDAFRRLATTADVLIEGFRPGVMKRLDLGYEQLRKLNPGLIHAALTGYGLDGSYTQTAGHDANYLAMAGVLDLIGPSGGPPNLPGIQIADIAAGTLPAVIGILLALAAREKSGEGQIVDAAMLDGCLNLMPIPLAQWTAAGETPRRGETRLSGRYACYNLYETSDGRWMSVGALEHKFWVELCRELDREDLIADQYADDSRQQEIKDELKRIFAGQSAAEWERRFAARDACVALVRDIEEVAADKHVRDRELIVSIPHPEGGSFDYVGVVPKLSATPGEIGGPPPQLGEHTLPVLRAAGMDEDTLAELRSEGVIA